MIIYYVMAVLTIYLTIQLMPIYVEVDFYACQDTSWNFKIIITTLFGIIKITLDTKRIQKILHKIISLRQKFSNIRQKIKSKNKSKKKKSNISFEMLKQSMMQFINSIILHKLYLKFFIGLKNASSTAIAMGFIYSIMGIMKPITNNISASNDYKENITIKPFYNQYKFEIELSCKIQFRLVHLTLITIRQIFNLIRRRIKKWIIIPSRA
ncbi:DUF2953 domain-containing protein [Natranaerofaba carboxydovora]|uniref:DUF2953 domain-containing protein n=1 Tax=Natranaerofaba carboxydovora TaxID=2742683 RepID=UPI001F13E235|nr:DUF2953 domain-containing protein [Natranaerofaba carboxydovora]UMZ73905.1 hypothetical protein ACONDI_01475 [Natranaerofaba carboxydovora]